MGKARVTTWSNIHIKNNKKVISYLFLFLQCLLHTKTGREGCYAHIGKKGLALYPIIPHPHSTHMSNLMQKYG